MLTEFAVYLVSAMTTWIPIANHSGFEEGAVTVARYQDIAADIDAVTSAEDSVFEGHNGRQKTALLLASIASYESSYAARVDECLVTGGTSKSKAFSIFQIHGNRDALCSDRRDAVRVALRMVRQSFHECRALPTLDRLGFYADGKCQRDWSRSRWRVGRAVRYWQAHPFEAVAPS